MGSFRNDVGHNAGPRQWSDEFRNGEQAREEEVAPSPTTRADETARVVEELQTRLEAKSAELLELKANYKAEVAQAVEDAKTRLARDAENQLQIDRARLIERLLPVLDNLALARETGERHQADPALLDGIVLVERQFLEILEGFGVRRFSAVGERFDPELHHAVGMVETPAGATPGVVVTELQPGYTLGDRLVRPAMVLVGRA